MPHHDRTIPPYISPFLKCLFSLGALYAGLAVAFQAIATHLPDTAFPLPRGRSMVHMAADTALWHGIALCALTLGALALDARQLHPHRLAVGCGGLALGTFLFSIPVTLHGFGILFPARLAPVGGTVLILSWFCVASAALFRTKRDAP